MVHVESAGEKVTGRIAVIAVIADTADIGKSENL